VPNVVHSPPTDMHAVECVLDLLEPCLKTVRNG
jgi:hypothetical protein